MYNKLELLFDDFYKVYYKMEELNLSLDIKCLTTTQLHIIKTIGDNKLSIKELSNSLGITMGTTSIAVTKLVNKKFLNRVKSKKDKRNVFVYLSKKGKLAFNFHDNFHTIILDKITKNIAKDDLENFIKTFEILYENIKKLKLKLEPENLTQFSEDETLEIREIKANSSIKLALSTLGIRVKTIIKISKINEDGIEVLINEEKKFIDKNQALSIMCIKRSNE